MVISTGVFVDMAFDGSGVGFRVGGADESLSVGAGVQEGCVTNCIIHGNVGDGQSLVSEGFADGT